MPKLLLVEDEPMLSRALVRLLDDMFSITVVTSAVEAWATLNLDYFDVLYIEVSIPGIHGKSFARELLERIPEIRPRVVLTFGGLCPEEMRELKTRFNCPVLNKPVAPELLRQVLSELSKTTPLSRSRTAVFSGGGPG